MQPDNISGVVNATHLRRINVNTYRATRFCTLNALEANFDISTKSGTFVAGVPKTTVLKLHSCEHAGDLCKGHESPDPRHLL